MKVEKRAVIAPPVEYVVTMSEEEAKTLFGISGFNSSIAALLKAPRNIWAFPEKDVDKVNSFLIHLYNQLEKALLI